MKASKIESLAVKTYTNSRPAKELCYKTKKKRHKMRNMVRHTARHTVQNYLAK